MPKGISLLMVDLARQQQTAVRAGTDAIVPTPSWGGGFVPPVPTPSCHLVRRSSGRERA